MKQIAHLVILITLAMLTACSNTSSFKVEGTVAGNATMNLRIIYAGDDVLNNVVTAARDGKFAFTGRSAEGTLVQVMDNEYRPLGFFYARNGMKIKVQITPSHPELFKVEGSAENERLTTWIAANATAPDLNRRIAAYVKAHPDDVVSTLLTVALYDARIDPVGARTLLESINAEARPSHLVESMTVLLDRVSSPTATGKVQPITFLSAADSMATFRPAAHKRNLLVVSIDERGRTDSIVERLRLDHRDGIHVVDLTLTPDTFIWQVSVRRDSAEWTRGWIPGGLGATGISRLGVSNVPFFIAIDASGRQLYRGPSLTAAEKALK